MTDAQHSPFRRTASDFGMPDPEGVGKIANALRAARLANQGDSWPGAVFLIGAGCSKSAGVPLAKEIAGQCCIKLARAIYQEKHASAPHSTVEQELLKFDDEGEALRFLKDERKLGPEVELSNAYGAIFQESFSNPMAQQVIIEHALSQRHEGVVNWAHLCLGELVRQGYVHTVLTTNFDQLTLEGMARAGVVPVVADGMSALARISSRPRRPQLAFLHGSLYSYALLNGTKDTQGTANAIEAGILYQLLVHAHALVVVGYAGGEEGIVQIINQAARFHHANDRAFDIYWTQHVADSEQVPRLSETVKEILRRCGNQEPIQINDADSFFACLMGRLNIRQPSFMENPLSDLEQFVKLIPERDNGYVQAFVTRFEERLALAHDCWVNTQREPTSARDLIIEARLSMASQDLDKALDEVLTSETIQRFDGADRQLLWHEVADISAGIVRMASRSSPEARDPHHARVTMVARRLADIVNFDDPMFGAFVLRTRAKAALWLAKGEPEELREIEGAIALIKKAKTMLAEFAADHVRQREAQNDIMRTQQLCAEACARRAELLDAEPDGSRARQAYRDLAEALETIPRERAWILAKCRAALFAVELGEARKDTKLVEQALDELAEALWALPEKDPDPLARAMRVFIQLQRRNASDKSEAEAGAAQGEKAGAGFPGLDKGGFYRQGPQARPTEPPREEKPPLRPDGEGDTPHGGLHS